MKKLYAVFLILFFSVGASAQPYGNEWIRFSINQPYSLQKYFKVQVWQEGIHRLTFNDINQVLLVTSFNPKNIQIFHGGKEQYIYVAGEGDNIFDPADYIEFYAKGNDGSFDTQLYDSPQSQLNPYFSLFNDTAAWFLTINADTLAVNKRMIIDNDSNFSNYDSAEFVIKETFKEAHDGGHVDGTSRLSVDASFQTGEGFAGNYFDATGNFSIPLPAPNAYTGGNPNAPNASVSALVLGKNTGGNARNWTVSVNGTSSAHYTWQGYTLNHYDTVLNNNSSLSGGSANFLFVPDNTNTDEINYAPYVKLVYPHTLNFANESNPFQKFTVKADAINSKTRLDILNFNSVSSSTRWLYVFSGDTIRKVNVDSGAVYQTLVPTFQTEKFCLLTTDAATLTSGHSVAPVEANSTHSARFTNFMWNNGLLPDYDFLMITHSTLMLQAVEYKDYKSSPDGGGFKVLIADIEELYDQFAEGINKHPQSIRNFCKFALDNFSVNPANPRFLFFIGKSVRYEYSRYGSAYSTNLVPTYGNPPSDQIFSSQLLDTIFHPAMATGRLPARTNQEVGDYLNKLIEHDEWFGKPPEEWMKNVLHFGGGHGGFESQTIAEYLEEYKKIIEDTLFGGHVTSFFRTTTDPIETNQSAYLQNLIDTGVTIMTFFSHAAGSTFDISTDVPQNYQNQGRYPLIIANSCYIGDIHSTTRQASENFVLLANKGAIGFIATPNESFIPDQPPYTRPLYKDIASYDYEKSIGECMKDAIDSIEPGMNDETRKSMAMGMTLNGDPSLRLYNFEKPDLQVTRPGVFFTPSVITAELDSFDINIVVKNLGRSIKIPYLLEVTRKFPDGTNSVTNVTLNNMPAVDTISIKLPMDIAHASGLNFFNVFVDAGFFPQVIDELNESNNRVDTVPLLIRSSDINPVYPFKYSIVPNANITLKASTANLFAPLTPYRFEVDITDRFNPPVLANVISSTGGVVEYQIPFALQPNTVYYWRVANDAITQNDSLYHWNESSFIYIPGKTGWSQAHYSQFKEDGYQNIIYADSMPPVNPTFKFVDIASSLICHATLTPDQLGGHPADFSINNNFMGCCGCGSYYQMNLAVLDSVTLAPWTTDMHDLGEVNNYDPATGGGPCITAGAPPPKQFIYHWGPGIAAATSNTLAAALDSVPDGDYILLYNLGGGIFSEWSSYLDSTFSNIASPAPSAQDYQPFIYFTKKGSGSAYIKYVDSGLNRDITLDTVIGGNWDKGYITSVKIGPAAQWTSLHWGQHPLEPTPQQDSISINVIGVDTNGQENVLIPDIPTTTPDLNINTINAQQYPYLKLQAYVQDELLRTPPQLDRWQIYYDEVPEAALAPNKFFQPVPLKDTLEEGDNFAFEMAVENISNVSMDSMLVDFYLYDKNHNRVNISSPRYDSLRVGQWIKAGVSFNTRNYDGLNSLWIEANPRNDQPEQYHFNNLADINFTVNRDITNPILDVTFDGQHILDGDIVSAKPFIFIQTKDENKFIALNDTTKYTVRRIIDPAGKITNLYFESAPNQTTDRSKLKWTPAALPDNSFKIEYNPVFDVDGVYQLEVQATDQAGNLSGGYSYKISFEVINRSTITDFINYPNPFSTATKFVFTLTGSEIPSYMKIQIMTVTGKVVREITQNELGPIHIGRNITEYAWDGKDEFGDRLANGIYLYRVITQLNGEGIEHRETTADHFFKKGYGKMYLLR